MPDEAIGFYINGRWIDPAGDVREIINPATEEVVGRVSLGSQADVDQAVAAARAAFSDYSRTTVDERLALLESISRTYEKRIEDLAQAMTREMGSPISFSREVQAANPLRHLEEMLSVLKSCEFDQVMGKTLVCREPIGVCGLITAWNWPVTLIMTKLVPALAAGCTVVLKPSENTPMSARIMAEIVHEAGVPSGVFNLVNGEGPVVGEALSRHADVDMISLTGSTRAGAAVSRAAADTIKRVTLELGGKSANIVLTDADLEKAIPSSVLRCFLNAGQSCQAPTRMLVHVSQKDEVVSIARRTAEAVRIGDPLDPETTMGPLANSAQFDKVRGLIEKGIAEGATLAHGGAGRPEGFGKGYFARPTIFADVTQDMTIAKEEIFGPVLSIMTYRTEDEAIEIANATTYGLAGHVQSGSIENARRIARKIRAGRIYLNGAPADRGAPMGGYKRSGNGREHGVFGLEEYLEVKAVLGYEA